MKTITNTSQRVFIYQSYNANTSDFQGILSKGIKIIWVCLKNAMWGIVGALQTILKAIILIPLNTLLFGMV